MGKIGIQFRHLINQQMGLKPPNGAQPVRYIYLINRMFFLTQILSIHQIIMHKQSIISYSDFLLLS